MAAQKGKDLLLKLDDGSGAFVTVAGLRSRPASASGAMSGCWRSERFTIPTNAARACFVCAKR